MTHTQGPWGVNALAANNANIYLTGLDGTKSPLGYIVQTATAPIAAMIETKAAAQLIAAAPDLLAALEKLTVLFDRMDRSGATNKAAYNDAIAAITKAKGN